MPTTDELYTLAQRAIQDYFRDRSAPMSQIEAGMESLRDELNVLIGSIPKEQPDAEVSK